MSNLDIGDRITYHPQGVVPSLRGQRGVITAIVRNGWFLVDFDRGWLSVKCSDVNLDKESAGT
jgi:hypothetical protein